MLLQAETTERVVYLVKTGNKYEVNIETSEKKIQVLPGRGFPVIAVTYKEQIEGEVPAGAVNGSNATFTTAFDFIPESVEVFVNGIRQKPITDYTTSGTTTILFTDSPLTGDIILVNYLKP